MGRLNASSLPRLYILSPGNRPRRSPKRRPCPTSAEAGCWRTSVGKRREPAFGHPSLRERRSRLLCLRRWNPPARSLRPTLGPFRADNRAAARHPL